MLFRKHLFSYSPESKKCGFEGYFIQTKRKQFPANSLVIVYGARDIKSHRGRIAQDRDRTNGKRIMYFILKFMHNYKAVATKLAKLSFGRFPFI